VEKEVKKQDIVAAVNREEIAWAAEELDVDVWEKVVEREARGKTLYRALSTIK
jgi:hypothetical protein